MDNDTRKPETTARKTRRFPRRWRKAPLLVAAAAAAALVLGAASVRASTSGPAVRFASCIRTHGVPNFPKPVNGRLLITTGTINPNSPRFKHALNVCLPLLSGLKPTLATE